MERYQNNPPYTRPYQSTCGMQRSPMSDCMPHKSRQMDHSMNVSCPSPVGSHSDMEMYSHVDHMVPAMAYVPCQTFETTFDLCHALKVGTIFPELCKPFCGKRGMMRC